MDLNQVEEENHQQKAQDKIRNNTGAVALGDADFEILKDRAEKKRQAELQVSEAARKKQDEYDQPLTDIDLMIRSAVAKHYGGQDE